MVRRLNIQDPSFEQDFTALLGLREVAQPAVEETVAEIIANVRSAGIEAVLELTARFDHLVLNDENVEISASETEASIATISGSERSALELAADRIRAYHQRQS